MESNIIVIGAGVSGLTAARHLQACGHPVTLIDKGRGVGGRVATRRIQQGEQISGRWDHGAQFATFRDPELIQHLKDWESWEIMEPWIPGFSDPDLYRKRPLQGMNAFAKTLAGKLDILTNQRILKLTQTTDGWNLLTETGDVFSTPYLVSTLPVPQFLELGENSKLPLTEAESGLLLSVQYDPCLTVLAELEGPPDLDPTGYHRCGTGILETLIDQHRKGISSSHTLIANANAAFSREWFHRTRNLSASIMLTAIRSEISCEIKTHQIHGWKYAKAVHRIPENFIQLKNGIFLAGDGFAAGGGTTEADHPPRIESAMLSGLAAAKKVVKQLNNKG